MREEAELAERRMQEHWNKVTAKQRLCSQLESQLLNLTVELSLLKVRENDALQVFSSALKEIENCRTESVQHLNEMTLTTIPSERKQAEEQIRQAKAQLKSMRKEQPKLNGASSVEGKVPQAARRDVQKKKNDIVQLNKQLDEAKKPPICLHHPLPDSRKSESDILTVLFYTHSHLAGSMPLLQQWCCTAQLAVCPWPLNQTPLWDVEELLSLESVTWQDHHGMYKNSANYLPQKKQIRKSTVATASAHDVSLYANFMPPPSSEVRNPLARFSHPGFFPRLRRPACSTELPQMSIVLSVRSCT